ncbi:signal peptidase I [Candidatus Parcubacteria bacterium]|nr:signal peptidase I [Candidatus Parcubacteria bacterium]
MLFLKVLFAILAISLIVFVLMVISLWKVFTKAGQPGWASIIPIYNLIIINRMAGKPAWWILLFFIPVVNIVVSMLIAYYLALAFGKGIGYTLGLFFVPFIFYPMLAFGDAVYQRSAPTPYMNP